MKCSVVTDCWIKSFTEVGTLFQICEALIPIIPPRKYSPRRMALRTSRNCSLLLQNLHEIASVMPGEELL